MAAPKKVDDPIGWDGMSGESRGAWLERFAAALILNGFHDLAEKSPLNGVRWLRHLLENDLKEEG